MAGEAMTAPTGYPLPWCEALDLPYWRVNLLLCALALGWRERQKGQAMATIIPWIDEMAARRELRGAQSQERPDVE